MPVCGPKLSICCSVLSVWAMIMLPIMGLLLKHRSITFIEDFEIDFKKDNITNYEEAMIHINERYEKAVCYHLFVTFFIPLNSLSFFSSNRY